jgi:hypothetical protein
MPKIFISYRREDSEAVTGRIDDRLVPHFGRGRVFLDVDTIPFGVDFRKHLDQAVGRCDVLLAVIGEQWLNARYPDGPKRGQRRLDDPADFVRLEIQSALARGIPVIPVLVGKATMPREEDLPDGLKPLVYRHAAEVRSGQDFHDHVDRLIRGIEQMLGGGQKAVARPHSGQRQSIMVTLIALAYLLYGALPVVAAIGALVNLPTRYNPGQTTLNIGVAAAAGTLGGSILLGAIGLLRRTQGGRILALIIAFPMMIGGLVLMLMCERVRLAADTAPHIFVFGLVTAALGIWAIVVLLGSRSAAEFRPR